MERGRAGLNPPRMVALAATGTGNSSVIKRRSTGIGNGNLALPPGQSKPQAKLEQSPSEPKTIPNPCLNRIPPKTTKPPGMKRTEVRRYLGGHMNFTTERFQPRL